MKKTLTFKFVNNPHQLTLDCSELKEHSLPSWAEYWINDQFFSPACSKALVVYDNQRLVGFFRYNLKNNTLSAEGTVVHPKYRNQGIGKQLWHKALQEHSPYSVNVSALTFTGKALTCSVQSSYPSLIMNINDYTYDTSAEI